MSESDMRGKVVSYLSGRDALAVENPCYPGTPDVNFIGGWLELKWLRAWPKKEDSIVQLEHYTQQQRLWLKKRHEKGGYAGLLLQCKREWFLFLPPNHMMVGKVPKERLYTLATCYTDQGMNKERLEQWLLNSKN